MITYDFEKNRRGVKASPTSQNIPSDDIPPAATPDVTSSTPNGTPTELTLISENDYPILQPDNMNSVLEELNISPSVISHSNLSPTQIQEIPTAIVNHQKKYGRITTELLHFIRDGYSSKKKPHLLPLKAVQLFLPVIRCLIRLLPILASRYSNSRDILGFALLKIGMFFMMFAFLTFPLSNLLKHPWNYVKL